MASLFSVKAYSATAIEYGLIAAQGLSLVNTSANQGSNLTINNPVILWIINLDSSTNLYKYTYVFQLTDSKATSLNFNGNLAIQTNATSQITNVTGATLVGAGTFSNPAISGSIQGLNFSFVENSTNPSVVISFNSPNAPMWASLILSGTSANGTLAETNLGYLQGGGSDVAVSTNYILVPGIAVPEPSMYMMMSLPLAFIAFMKGRKKALQPVVR